MLELLLSLSTSYQLLVSTQGRPGFQSASRQVRPQEEQEGMFCTVKSGSNMQQTFVYETAFRDRNIQLGCLSRYVTHRLSTNASVSIFLTSHCSDHHDQCIQGCSGFQSATGQVRWPDEGFGVMS